MKIAVVGAGIVGITSAWELAQDDHQVTVLEQRGAAAEEASFANAGLVGASALLLNGTRWPPATGLAGWWRNWRSSDALADAAALARLQRLAAYSRARLHQITSALQLEYEHRESVLVLLRSEKDHALAQAKLQILRDAGVALHLLDEPQARQLEPALNPDTPFFGAVQLPHDEAGNCRQFALLLKNEALRAGVNFEFNTPVASIEYTQGATIFVALKSPPRHFDAVVLCAGASSAALLKPLGLALAMQVVQGCSISARIREPLHAPRSALLDMHHGAVISRLGQRVRVAGSLAAGGQAHSGRSLQKLYALLHDWFPGAGLISTGVQEWQGRCLRLPGGPAVGASGKPGIWLNLGHGTSGWALACGSAKVLADLVAGRTPEVDLHPTPPH